MYSEGMMSKELSLEAVLKEIQNPLNLIEERFKKYVVSQDEVMQKMVDYVFSKQGKQVRPALLFITSQIWEKGHKSSRYQDIVDLGLCIELIHIATLVHDDVNDDAKLRRGSKTYNSKWGRTASVLFGDFLFSKAFVILSKFGSLKIIEYLSETTSKICVGEIRQNSFRNNYKIKIQDYLSIIEDKTASLIAESCRVGSLISFSDSVESQEKLYRYGHNLGMAFQLYDDYLDFVGNKEELGKDILKDILNGYITLPVIHALDTGGIETGVFIELLEGAKNEGAKNEGSENEGSENEGSENEGNLAEVVSLLKKMGSIDYTRAKAEYYIEQAKKEVKGFENEKMRILLNGVADFVVNRRC